MTTGEVIALIEAFGGGSGGSSSGGVLVVNVTLDTNTDTYTADKTASEIWTGLQNGVVIFKDEGEDYAEMGHAVNASFSESDGYIFGVLMPGNSQTFDYTAESGTDYPSYIAR